MSAKRIVTSCVAAVALSVVGLGLAGGVANAAQRQPTASDYCVDTGGIAIVDDETPNETTCYWDHSTGVHFAGDRYFEYYMN